MQHMTSPEINPWLLDSLTWQERRLPSEFSSWLNFNSKPEEIWRDKRIYIYIHFFHKLQFLWFCFLIFLSPSDAIYSSLLSLPLSWVAWVHWRHVSHEAPVAVQLQFLPEPPGVQAIGIGEGARKCKGEYDKKDQQRSKHMQDRQECTIAVRCILTLKQSCCMLKNSAARLIIVGFCSRLFKLTSCSFSNLLQRRAILIA